MVDRAQRGKGADRSLGITATILTGTEAVAITASWRSRARPWES